MENKRNQTHKIPRALLITAVLVISGIAIRMLLHSNASVARVSTVKTQQAVVNVCKTNTQPKLVIVSVSQRHMWACNEGSPAFDSAVITGMERISDDRTPRGTYHVYAKQTDRYLDGSDSTGSWHDYVSYWMPFSGDFGFHDATWRADKDFGNIDPDTDKASHGCVELPLTTAKQLYEWAKIGTTITIKS